MSPLSTSVDISTPASLASAASAVPERSTAAKPVSEPPNSLAEQKGPDLSAVQNVSTAKDHGHSITTPPTPPVDTQVPPSKIQPTARPFPLPQKPLSVATALPTPVTEDFAIPDSAKTVMASPTTTISPALMNGASNRQPDVTPSKSNNVSNLHTDDRHEKPDSGRKRQRSLSSQPEPQKRPSIRQYSDHWDPRDRTPGRGPSGRDDEASSSLFVTPDPKSPIQDSKFQSYGSDGYDSYRPALKAPTGPRSLTKAASNGIEIRGTSLASRITGRDCPDSCLCKTRKPDGTYPDVTRATVSPFWHVLLWISFF